MKWTILFIIHGLDEGLQEQSTILRNVISHGNWSLKYINLLYLKSEIVPEGRNKKYVAVLNRVSPWEERRRGEPDVTVVKRFANINIGSKNRMADVFSFVRNHYPAERLMLMMFDHGAGFGIFDAIPKENRPVYYESIGDLDYNILSANKKDVKRVLVPSMYYQYKTDRSKKKAARLSGGVSAERVKDQLRYYGKKYAATDMLTMEELSISIRRGFRKKVDVMVLVNCNMQMAETAYSLRNSVEYLVASESLFWVYGINYREVLWQLDNIRNISPAKVAARCVETMPFRYERIFKKENLNDVSFTALHVARMDLLFEKFDELAGSWLKEPEKYIPLLGKARKAGADLSQFNYTREQREKYEPLFFYDLLHLIKCAAPRDNRVKEIIRLFMKARIARYIGSDFRKGRTSIVNGMSVYFPFNADDFEMKYFGLFYKEDARFKVDFANTNWGRLIRAIKKQAES